MSDLVTKQPVKGLYAILATILEIARYPVWVLQYHFPSARPDPAWTLRQALGVRIAKAIAHHMVVVHKKTAVTLEPGKEGNRFTIMDPYGQDDKFYQGAASDSQIKPGRVGATWHKQPLSKGQKDVEVVLHMHGGAYVYGNGRDEEMAFPASQFLQHARVTHVLMPGYRISSNPGGRFPAALQDAITSYLYLVKTLEIPASRITISGDSAGGNLTLCLLRYIQEHEAQLDIPWPACVWLWSPWPNVYACLDKTYMPRQPNYKLDIVGANFGYWGASTVSEKYNGPYLDPLNNPFKSKSPIFMAGGGAETVLEDIKHLAKNLEAEGNRVELLVQAHCPHDIIASGHHLGFVNDASEAAKQSGEFLRAHRHDA